MVSDSGRSVDRAYVLASGVAFLVDNVLLWYYLVVYSRNDRGFNTFVEKTIKIREK
jgi:hypothetical protein